MWWVPVAMAAGSMLQENERQKQLAKHNQGQAEMTKYSPWTGVRGQTQADTGPGIFGAGISGGASGLAMSQAMQGMGGAQGAGGPKTMSTTMDTSNQYNFNRPGQFRGYNQA